VPAAIAHRRLLVWASFAAYAVVFAVFVFLEKPGLGTGHFFYLPVALMALATGPWTGGVAGALAAALFALGIFLNPHYEPAEIVTISTLIRLAMFSFSGALIGWFVHENRALVEQLTILAERDAVTGLPNTRAFETAIERRLEGGSCFALLIGDLDEVRSSSDDPGSEADVLRRLADMLGRSLSPEDEIARVGGNEFAVLASATSSGEAARLCARLEATLAQQGLTLHFGWALHPDEGRNALSLYRAADERLYARKLLATRPLAAAEGR
jgi:diguanylate cyclase (GGDEF)-like protein